MAAGHDIRKARPGDGPEAAIPGAFQHLDHARAKPAGHGDDPDALKRILLATPSGAQIPVEQVAKISFSRGPAMLRDEDGQLTGYVYIDLNTKDYGGFVNQATSALHDKLKMQPGYAYHWSG